MVGSPYGWLPRRHDGSDGEDIGESCGGGATRGGLGRRGKHARASPKRPTGRAAGVVEGKM